MATWRWLVSVIHAWVPSLGSSLTRQRFHPPGTDVADRSVTTPSPRPNTILE